MIAGALRRHGKGEAAKEEWRRSRNGDGGVGDPRLKGVGGRGCKLERRAGGGGAATEMFGSNVAKVNKQSINKIK